MEEKKHIEIGKIRKERPFAIPENYFNDFVAKMDEIVAEDTREKKSFKLRPWMFGVAASLIGVVFMGQIYFSENKNEKLASETYDTYVLSQVSESVLIDYYLTSNAENGTNENK